MRYQAIIAALVFGSLSGSLFAQNFSDNFDGYADGSFIEGQGGWADWGCAPTNTSTVSTDFALSGPNSLRIVGGTGPSGNTTDVTQTFGGVPLGSSGGQWTITTNVYIPGGFTGTSWYILLNEFGACGTGVNWSSDINFSSASNMVTCDCGSGSLNGVTFGPMIYDQWIEIRHELDLDADTADVFWNGGAAPVASYQWSNGFPPAGTAQIACIDLFPDSATTGAIYYDDISVVKTSIDGMNYCVSLPNSSGSAALMSATGSTFLADQDLTLESTVLPDNVFGIFYYGGTPAAQPFGNGFRCVGGAVQRLPIEQAVGDTLTHVVDFASPQAGGIGLGTVYFQAWFRDTGDPAGFQLSDGLSIVFQ